MIFLSNQYKEYIDNPKSFYDFIHLHDGIILEFSYKKDYLEILVDAHEWEHCNYKLIFKNPKSFYIKKETSTNLFVDNKELIGLKLDDCILDFNLIKINGEIYFYFLLCEYMHQVLFQADSLEIIQIDI